MFFYMYYGKMILECKHMSLFKKKRRVEEININIANSEEDKDNIIEEEKEVVIEKMLPEEAIALANKKYNSLLKAYNNLLYNFYLCKFFSLAVYKDSEELNEFARLEHQVIITKDLFENVKDRLNKLNGNH